MKLYLYSFFITYVIAFDNLLYEFSKNPENYQPSGSIQDKLMENLQIITFKKIYKRHTNFALENYDNYKKSDFGQTFTFSPLNDFCNTDFEKDLYTRKLLTSIYYQIGARLMAFMHPCNTIQ